MCTFQQEFNFALAKLCFIFIKIFCLQGKMASTTEPIPLRTLTTLLNYEKMISDPVFMNTKLFQSSLADPGFVNRGMINYPSLFEVEPATIQ